MATVEGTRRFLSRAAARGALHPGNVRNLKRTDLSCSAIGFGGYRIGGGKEQDEHRAAVLSAIRAGVNLLDTSSHYTASWEAADAHGASERLIGQLIAEAVAAGDASRDELIVCTKVGHAPGGVKPEGSVPVSDSGNRDHWHSIASGFVDSEIRASCERLGTVPDFVLLHNPEYFLQDQLLRRVSIADAWDAMYDQLQQTFSTMESLCKEGLIGSGYGVSANFLSCMNSVSGRPNLYEALIVDRVLDAARVAAGGRDAHHLQVVQLPLNIVESAALLGRPVIPEATEGDVPMVERLGLSTITNRPLNAIPVPGVSSGDWEGPKLTHLRLKDSKPMGAIPQLLKRVVQDALGEEAGINAAQMTLQQLSLRLASSTSAVSCTLLGMRRQQYVDDAAAVLKLPPLAPEIVVRAHYSVRSCFEELGGQHRSLW